MAGLENTLQRLMDVFVAHSEGTSGIHASQTATNLQVARADLTRSATSSGTSRHACRSGTKHEKATLLASTTCT
jgi:hypothetical protein